MSFLRRALPVLLMVCLLAGITLFAGRVAAQGAQPVVIYFFWGDGCPHCAHAKPVLAELAARYPNVEVRDFEIYNVEANRDVFLDMAAAVGFEARYVPTIIIGERYWTGFSDEIAVEIETQIQACSSRACPDAGLGVIPGVVAPTPTVVPVAPEPLPTLIPEPTPAPAVITVPLIGQINLDQQSLALSTAIIAFVDGFNPCSLWVLSILISLTLRTGSRKKIFIIGFVFLTVTSLVYVLFIAGLFTMFTFISFMGWIQVVVALMALFFAAVNIKDYFWYKEGVSFTIADEKKPGIYKNMRKILNADSLWTMITATIVMSAGVSLVEFSCTAGFPVLWTTLLSAQGVSRLTFALLLALYMLIYQIDELAIFLIAVFTLKSNKLEEKHGRILKLIGGTLMLTLAAVMLINPKMMNEISSTLIIFGVAFALAMVTLWVHRQVLPHYGIYIGTELAPLTKPGKRPSGTRRRRA